MTFRVTLVGAGALGSHVALFLRSADLDLRVVDFDRVERKNVLSQFHGLKTVGKSKVQSLQQTLQFLFGRRIEAVPQRLRSDNQAALLGGADLLVDALDNLAARRLVSDFARAEGVPCLHGALAADGQFGRVIWDEDFVADPEGALGAPTCEDGAHLAFIGIVAAHLAYAAQRFCETGDKRGFSVSPAGATVV